MVLTNCRDEISRHCVCRTEIFLSNYEYIIRSWQAERALGVRPRVRSISITHTRLGKKIIIFLSTEHVQVPSTGKKKVVNLQKMMMQRQMA